MVRPFAAELRERLAACPGAGREWLYDLVAAVEHGERFDGVPQAFSEAARRVGKGTLSGILGPADAPVAVLDHWSADDAARAVLLLAVADSRPAELPALVEELYRGGDAREKAALVRALVLLPDPRRFRGLATDAGRASDMTIFRALACGNVYPSLYYSEREWNALLMKAVFVGVSLDEVVGLRGRLSPELARMALDYVDERESAARAVPPSVWELIGRGAAPPALGRLIGYLNHSLAEHRQRAARALARLGDRRAASFLEERAASESDPAVAAAVREAVATLGPQREGTTERSA